VISYQMLDARKPNKCRALLKVIHTVMHFATGKSGNWRMPGWMTSESRLVKLLRLSGRVC